jgi:hypothetical protein
MEQSKDAIFDDEGIWKKTLEPCFLSPPSQWIFQDNAISFGNNLYDVNEVTLYELALLDIHVQYWESTSPEHLQRYHRSLQNEVEGCFKSNKSTTVHSTPLFLRSWLARFIFKKKHNPEGREKMLQVLNDISAVERYKLETGGLQSDGINSNLYASKGHFSQNSLLDWKQVIHHKYHQNDLMKMIKSICDERRILRHGKTKYSWRLAIFNTIEWDDGETQTAVIQSSIPSFCLLYQHELAAIIASGSRPEGGLQWDPAFIESFKLPIMIKNIPFSNIQARRLLTGNLIDDEIINAYLILCGYLRPDIKFLNSFWLDKLKIWGHQAAENSVRWVS